MAAENQRAGGSPALSIYRSGMYPNFPSPEVPRSDREPRSVDNAAMKEFSLVSHPTLLGPIRQVSQSAAQHGKSARNGGKKEGLHDYESLASRSGNPAASRMVR